jgi:hypothetical protein
VILARIPRAGAFLLGVVLVGSSACVSLADRTDQTAGNVEDTGQYSVLATQEPEPGVLHVTLRVENLAAADRVARDFVHQKLNLGFRAIRIDVIGPDDKPDAPARRQLRWPEDLDSTSG